jgi:6-pyruvoyl-tetrahydropterin synthase
MRLERTYHAEVAHQLLAGVPDGHPCRRLHGHRYIITITLIGDVDPSTGMLMEYADIDRRISEVLGLVDHRFLNELGFNAFVVGREIIATPIDGIRKPELAAKVRENSTIENVADWMLAELKERFPRLDKQVGVKSFLEPQVYALRIEEDRDSAVERAEP